MKNAVRRRAKVSFKGKCYIVAICFLVVLAWETYQMAMVSDAATVRVGTVAVNAGSTLRVRSGPGTTYGAIGSLSSGAQITITGEENGWYAISFNGGSGYVSAEFISDVKDMEIDENYINTLTALGFPYSYAVPLNELHAKYPNWVFEPVMTGLDWNTVIGQESKGARNLVQKNVNDARKSTDTGYYDWGTNTWYAYDTGNWVGASSDYIAYCMDPRNWLDENYIFQFESLAYSPSQTVEGVGSILSGSFMAGNYTENGTSMSYADTFYQVGSKLQVSPYHLASRCLQEQGTGGTSPLISGTYPGYEGYYNFFNVGATGAGQAAVIANGLAYARNQGWNTRYKAIYGGGTVISSKYIQKGQNTIYFEKFNVVNTAGPLYSHQYMQNVDGARNEGSRAGSAYGDRSQAFVFRIPVYNNMPESPASFGDSGNPNNWLSSMTVSSGSITPGFSGANTSYTLVVPENVSSITVNAKTVASTSSVSGTGTYSLQYGNNPIQVTCTAQNGNPRTYQILVARQGGNGGNTGGSVTRGDVNGDGRISNADIVLMKRHILSVATLSGTAFTAADINQDGRISNADIVRIKRHILGVEPIQ